MFPEFGVCFLSFPLSVVGYREGKLTSIKALLERVKPTLLDEAQCWALPRPQAPLLDPRSLSGFDLSLLKWEGSFSQQA